MVVEFPDRVFIMEFKCVRNVRAALEQIHEKGYADMFAQKGKKRILMGIDFSPASRSVAGWETEVCGN